MEKIFIRKCSKKDKKGIVNVCYHTGYMGEDAQGHFYDKKLFGLLFCAYYPLYETNNCFIAIVNDQGKERTVGYILSALDTKEYEKKFKKKFLWRIIFRTVFITSWRYFRDFKLLYRFIKNRETGSSGETSFYKDYPAHLHIDVLEKYQHQGIGIKLIKTLEKHLFENNIKGVCLGTSERNYKSIPFYKKNGYEILQIIKGNFPFWPENDEIKSLIFGKRFLYL